MLYWDVTHIKIVLPGTGDFIPILNLQGLKIHNTKTWVCFKFRCPDNSFMSVLFFFFNTFLIPEVTINFSIDMDVTRLTAEALHETLQSSVQKINDCVRQYPSIHYLYHLSLRGGVAGANPSWHWLRGSVHHGQIGSLSQSWHTETCQHVNNMSHNIWLKVGGKLTTPKVHFSKKHPIT